MERRKRNTLSRCKRAKLRKMKIRRRISILVLLLILIGVSFFVRDRILIAKCQDLYYATEHYMTTGVFNSNKLLRVQTMKLIFSDTDSAVVEAQGLSDKAPNPRTTYKAFFKKNSNDSWTLEKSVLVDNTEMDEDTTAQNIVNEKGSN